MFYQKEDLDDELQDVSSLKNKFNDHYGMPNYKLPNPIPPAKEKPKIAEKPKDVKTRNMVNNQINHENLAKNPEKKSNSNYDLNAHTVDSEIKETFSNVANRIKDKVKQKSFAFTMMVVGESGLGKSTLVNQLFNCQIYDQNNPGPSFKPCQTARIDVNRIHLVENKVNLFLNLVDSPGFGNFLDNSNCCVEIMDFIEKKFDEYLMDETKFGQTHIPDNRVHCCLYFIQPTGHNLKSLDIEFMKKLSSKVNLVPIIAKADTLTPEELQSFKKKILDDIKKNSIDIYPFPNFRDELNFNKDERDEHNFYKSLLPFAIISSNQISVDDDGRRRRLRKYPWGTIDVENLEYSDFIAMKKLIIKYHLIDMVEKTNTVHYEKYRLGKLDAIEEGNSKPKRNPLSLIEEEKKAYEEKIVKMKDDMEKVFESKVSKKVQRLDDIKSELEKKEREMKEQLIEMNGDLKQRRERFLKEKEAFELVRKEVDELIIANQEAEPKKKEKKKGLF